MKAIYNKIWEAAEPIYARGRAMDLEHVKWMKGEAQSLCDKEDIDDSLLMPMVILHDIGYSKASEAYFEKDLKLAHMQVGSEMAKEILSKLNYPQDKIDKIAYGISVHDFWIFKKNDVFKDKVIGTLNDLDFIWMTTQKGFELVREKIKFTNEQMLDLIENDDKFEQRPFKTKYTKQLYEKNLKSLKSRKNSKKS